MGQVGSDPVCFEFISYEKRFARSASVGFVWVRSREREVK